MLITNASEGHCFRDAFEANLNVSSSVRIASGYFGASEITRYERQFCEIARNGGVVQLIHGMGGAEGIRKNLYNKLNDLDTKLRATNPENRIFVHKTHYHGKMYITGDDDNSKVLIGSSNFSSSGFGRNIELNYSHSDQELRSEAGLFFDRLKNNSIPITNIVLPDQLTTEHSAPKIEAFDASVFTGVADHSISVRVTERSNLNLFLSTGRLNTVTGIYSPRPFYEVELTIGKDDLPSIRRSLPAQLEPATFQAITDIGTTFPVKFKRKTSSGGDLRTLHETGIDFMSSPRKELGHYMKGKLMRQGVLSFGEPVTEDVLFEYGKTSLDMYFVGNNQVYIKF